MVRRAIEIPVRGEDVIAAGDGNFSGVIIKRRRFHQVGRQDIARDSRGLGGRRGDHRCRLFRGGHHEDNDAGNGDDGQNPARDIPLPGLE